MTPTSLVTGGAGFLGAHVAESCLALGHKVVVLDDLSGGFESNVPEGALFVKGSVNDHALIDQLFEEHAFHYVYHLAAYAAEGLSHFVRRFNYNNNLIGSVNLINAAVNTGGVKRFVFTSSIAVYGHAKPPMREDTVPIPADPYGIAKYAVELDLAAAHDMYGLDYTIFRPHNIYGEKQNTTDKYRNVIGIFLNQLRQGKPMTIFGDGLQTRAFTYVRDVAPLIARSVTLDAASNQVFNIGAQTPYTILELSEVLAKALDVEAIRKFEPARNEVVHAFSDHGKIAEVFGELHDTPLAEGIARMTEWTLAQSTEQSPTRFEGIEVFKNMPPSWAKDYQ